MFECEAPAGSIQVLEYECFVTPQRVCVRVEKVMTANLSARLACLSVLCLVLSACGGTEPGGADASGADSGADAGSGDAALDSDVEPDDITPGDADTDERPDADTRGPERDGDGVDDTDEARDVRPGDTGLDVRTDADTTPEDVRDVEEDAGRIFTPGSLPLPDYIGCDENSDCPNGTGNCITELTLNRARADGRIRVPITEVFSGLARAGVCSLS